MDPLQHSDELGVESPLADLPSVLDALCSEVARLRKTLLKLGHAQELFQSRIEEEVGSLARRWPAEDAGRTPPGVEGAVPSSAQLRALMELDQAVLNLLDLTRGAEGRPPAPEDGPRSVREGLVLLQVRARNLEWSFGLEPIPALGSLFDDRHHQAYGLCDLPGLADGEVAEELLPGYRLRGQVVRPALVIVNRHGAAGPTEDEGAS